MIDQLKYLSLKSLVQKRMFCPACNQLLDVSRSAEICVIKDFKPIAIDLLCTSCFDLLGGVKKLSERITARGLLHDGVEILDGREADWEMIYMMQDV